MQWQWNQAQLGIQEILGGKKQQASSSVAIKVDKETVVKFVDFCLRPDKMQGKAYYLPHD